MPESRSYAAVESRIAEMLSGARKFAVPAHQRNYEWDEEEVGQFWQDCVDVFEGRAQRLFVGSIVTNQQGEPDLPGRLSIVDGQQRLATATICFACIHRKAVELKSTGVSIHPEGMISKLGKPDVRTGELEANILLNLADRDGFLKLISPTSPPPIDEVVALAKSKLSSGRAKYYAAYALIHERINKMLAGKSPTDQVEVLYGLYKAMEDVALIDVNVRDDDAAYDLFETLNDRGLPLSIVDLLKNHLFRNAGTHLTGVKHEWQEFEGEFASRRDIPAFVTFVWRATKGVVRRHELFRLIKQEYKSETQCRAFVGLLNQFASAFTMLANPEGSDQWPEGSLAPIFAADLDVLGTKQWYPLAMVAILKLPPDQMEKVLGGLVKFVVRYTTVCEKPPMYLEGGFSSIAVKVWKGEYTSWGKIRDDLKAIPFYPSDAEFSAAFPDCEPRAAEARFLLGKIEAKLRGDPAFLPRYYTLEHVNPQNPENIGDWDAAFNADPIATEHFKYRLANLTLLEKGKNKAARNKKFVAKVPLLAASEVLISKAIAKYPKWDKVEMDERGRLLSEEAKQIWGL